MKTLNWKNEVNDKVTKLQQDAVFSEKVSQRELERIGINKKAKEIIADKQYWNGYLDALNNITKEIKKIN